jgi:hypothetical protein
MHRQSTIPLKGNERFEGFGIELIHELSLMLGFNYTFELQLDNAYGSLNKETGQWNGMMRQLLDEVMMCMLYFVLMYPLWCGEHVKLCATLCFFMFQKADLAITDLTITSEREAAVDFTNPFMSLGE